MEVTVTTCPSESVLLTRVVEKLDVVEVDLAALFVDTLEVDDEVEDAELGPLVLAATLVRGSLVEEEEEEEEEEVVPAEEEVEEETDEVLVPTGGEEEEEEEEELVEDEITIRG